MMIEMSVTFDGLRPQLVSDAVAFTHDALTDDGEVVNCKWTDVSAVTGVTVYARVCTKTDGDDLRYRLIRLAEREFGHGVVVSVELLSC